MFDLKDKIIVIVGGVGLLGAEFAKAVADIGATSIIADLNEDKARDFIGEKNNMDYFKLDITSKSSVLEMINYIVSKYGKIDAIVNSAYPRNKNYGRKFEDVTYEDFCENINLHLGGYFLVSQQFAEFFSKQGYGNIINISSIYGVIAPRFEVYDNTKMTMPVEYAAIKSALIHLTKYIAKYYKSKNIRINCISPGGIYDGQPNIFLDKYKSYSLNKGMLNKSDITGTLIFLLSDMSKYINGQNIIVDDGWTL